MLYIIISHIDNNSNTCIVLLTRVKNYGIIYKDSAVKIYIIGECVDILLTNFIIGVFIALTPCVLPLIPIYSRLISSTNHKYAVLFFFIVYIILCYGALGVTLMYFDIISYFQIVLPTLFIIAGLIYLDFLVIPPSYSTNGNIYVSLLMLPIVAASCTLPAFLIAVSVSSNSVLSLIGLGLGYNLPIIIGVCFGDQLIKIIPSVISNVFKMLVGTALIFIGIQYSLINDDLRYYQYYDKSEIRYEAKKAYFFSADWCIYCKKLKKAIDFSKYNIELIDLTTVEPLERALMLKLGVTSGIPAVVVEEKGKIRKVTGYNPKEVRKLLGKYKKEV